MYRQQRFAPQLRRLGDAEAVVGFEEKPDYSFIVSMGLYVFNRSVLEYVPDDEPYGFDQLILKLLRFKRKVYAFPYDGYWLDIGRPADYARALEDLEKIKGMW